ncbi:MAG: hypothetical protein RLZZ628_573 [Bacteroidota bacterium]
MENKENDSIFDDIIRNSMHRAEQDSDNRFSSDFDQFEKRLRRVEKTADDAFDNWIRNAAERHEAPQNAAHWARMEQELEEAFSWKRYIIRFKIPELILSGLAIWTFLNVFDTSFERKDAVLNQNASKIQVIAPKSRLSDSKIAPLQTQKPSIESTKTILNPKTDWNKRAGDAPILEQDKVDKHPLLQFKGSEGAPQAAIENPTIPIQAAVQNGSDRKLDETQDVTAMLPVRKATDLVQQNDLNEDNLQNILSDAASNALTINGLKRSKKQVESIDKKVDDLNAAKKQAESLNTLAMIQPELLKTAYPILAAMPIAENTGYKNRRFRIGMFGAFNADNANTFYSSLSIAGKAVRATDGYGSGVTVGYRKGGVEIESGLTYSFKSYRPVDITAITGDFTNGYVTEKPKLVSFNMLHIPIHANFYLYDKKKWSIYGSIGAAATMAMQTDYDISKTVSAPLTQSRVDPNANTTQNSVMSLYKRGALEGASLDNNYYFTANAGAGIEYQPKFRGRWSIFAQSLYQQHIGNQGVGENQDKISTFSIQIGAKARL